ncbi:MAG: sulfurtransferase TusA family protein [Actinobacteria bacterium]|nr:sulfurtransferase TusA family protein [Actinomycetota bacterium]MCI0543256.1 sulfurtransferase TusA family protein [Actinomycetota bacterium]MCI0678336.1 sulfurtransferase TusA family protein [Actinomycetota bacterium]
MTDTTHDQRADATLDCSGLLCPLPVYKASLALRQLSPGQVLHLVTTDPGALEDVPAMARQTGDTLLGVERTETNQLFWIEKGPHR